MATYRTKLVQIEAHRFDGDEGALVRWIESTRKPGRFRFDKGAVFIETLEGEMRGDVGDYIICGLRGEFYPCKPDVFHAKYELAAAPAHTGAPESPSDRTSDDPTGHDQRSPLSTLSVGRRADP